MRYLLVEDPKLTVQPLRTLLCMTCDYCTPTIYFFTESIPRSHIGTREVISSYLSFQIRTCAKVDESTREELPVLIKLNHTQLLDLIRRQSKSTANQSDSGLRVSIFNKSLEVALMNYPVRRVSLRPPAKQSFACSTNIPLT